MKSGNTKHICTLLLQDAYTVYNNYIQWSPNTSQTTHTEKRIELRNVVLELQWFSWSEAVCVFSWGMCRPSWNSVNGAPLKGCIVWTLTKPNWFGQILTEGHVEGCPRVCVQVCVWMFWHGSECVCSSVHVHLPYLIFAYKYPLCVAIKRYKLCC